MSKASKRNQVIEHEVEDQDDDTPSGVSVALSKVLSALRTPLALAAAHRWKIAAAAGVAAVGLAIGTGMLDIGKLASSVMTASAPAQDTAATASGPAVESSASEVAAVDAPVETQAATLPSASKPGLKACFTPNDDCVAMIVAEIDAAKAEILVQSNSFSAKPLIKALGRAHKRGVKVRVILDKADEHRRDRGGSWLISERILPQVDTGVVSAHSKVMIIDRDAVITGSFNFTEAAQKKNAENVLLIKGHADVASAYMKNWERRLAASRPYYGTMAPVL